MRSLSLSDLCSLGLLIMMVALTAIMSPGTVVGWWLPCTAVFTWAFLRFAVPTMPSSLRIPDAGGHAGWVVFLCVALFFGLQVVQVLLPTRRLPVDTLAILCAFYVPLGLLLPRIRRNPWVGIRLPWTRDSEETWAATHRLGGGVFVVAGLLGLWLVAAGLQKWVGGVLSVAGLVPIVFAWWHHQRHVSRR